MRSTCPTIGSVSTVTRPAASGRSRETFVRAAAATNAKIPKTTLSGKTVRVMGLDNRDMQEPPTAIPQPQATPSIEEIYQMILSYTAGSFSFEIESSFGERLVTSQGC